MANAGAEFRVLTHSDVDLVLINHRRGDDVVFRSAAAFLKIGGLGIAIELPDRLARLGFEAAKPAVAASKHDLALAVDHGISRVGPLSEHDLAAGRVVLPGDLAGLLVDGDETGRVR